MPILGDGARVVGNSVVGGTMAESFGCRLVVGSSETVGSALTLGASEREGCPVDEVRLKEDGAAEDSMVICWVAIGDLDIPVV